jgi:hypothetical protein
LAERFEGFCRLFLDLGIWMLEIFLKLLKEIRKQSTLAIIRLEIKLSNGHCLNKMTDSVSHNLTTFTAVKLRFLYIWNDVSDRGSDL